jgi:hypothetical protein
MTAWWIEEGGELGVADERLAPQVGQLEVDLRG